MDPFIRLELRNGIPMVSSRVVAEDFEKRHDNILRLIEEKLTDSKLRTLKWMFESEYL